MTYQEKREQRIKLKIIRDELNNVIDNIGLQISDLCHNFTEQELISLGWVKANFSAAYMAYEYKQNDKYIIFLDKSGDVLSCSGSPTKFFEDVEDLTDYLSA